MDYSDETQNIADAEAHAAAGRWQAAVQVLREIIARKPKDLLYRQRLAELLSSAGERDEAVRVLEDISDRLARDGMLLRAITVGKLILSLDPSHTDAHRKVADLYARKHGAPPPPSFLPPLPPPPPRESSVTTEKIEDVQSLLAAAKDVVQDAHDELATPSGEARAPLEEIPHSPLFADLDHAAFLDVVKTLALRRAEANQRIVVEGERGTSMFIIVRGEVAVERAGQEVHVLGPGAFFGEMALLNHTPRMATVRAKQEVLLLELDEEQVRALMAAHPSMAGVLEGFHRRRMLTNVTASSPLFQALAPDERRALLEKFTPVATRPGEILLTQGEPGDGLYLVLRGQLEVSALDGDAPQALPPLREGELFGEVSLVYETPCTATVKALNAGVVLKLKREDFRDAIPADSQAMASIRKLGTERLRRWGMESVLA